MTNAELERRIVDLENLISRDASYTVPSNRINGEQTLALWQIALELAHIREALADMPTGPLSIQSFGKEKK